MASMTRSQPASSASAATGDMRAIVASKASGASLPLSTCLRRVSPTVSHAFFAAPGAASNSRTA